MKTAERSRSNLTPGGNIALLRTLIASKRSNFSVRLAEQACPQSLPVPRVAPALHEDMFLGANPRMQALRASLPKVAGSDVPILIQGETGTGKEVLAREIHALSSRADKPFFKLNCAAVPSDLMESELFGYERGAFTGAFQRKPGVFELADGGTILLDEVGDMDIQVQAKLLQVLQDHEFRRLGGRGTIRVDVRVIAATHRDLFEAIHSYKFREDLYYRLNVLTLTLPALRERPEDIPGIVDFLIRRHASRETPPIALTPRLKDAFLTFDWPGNIRQMENVVRKLMVLRDPEVIIGELNTLRVRRQVCLRPAQDIPEKKTDFQDKTAGADLVSILDQVTREKREAEAAAILEALQETRGNRKQAAARLNIAYKALLYKMKKLSTDQPLRGSSNRG
jgi:two-component system response regulator AtoC